MLNAGEKFVDLLSLLDPRLSQKGLSIHCQFERVFKVEWYLTHGHRPRFSARMITKNAYDFQDSTKIWHSTRSISYSFGTFNKILMFLTYLRRCYTLILSQDIFRRFYLKIPLFLGVSQHFHLPNGENCTSNILSGKDSHKFPHMKYTLGNTHNIFNMAISPQSVQFHWKYTTTVYSSTKAFKYHTTHIHAPIASQYASMCAR